MNHENKIWESVKQSYLKQVEESLKSAGHPNPQEILDDVSSHLDQKFAELSPDQYNWENFQKIIIEMGPPSDYAELLGEKVILPNNAEMGIWRRFVVNAAISITIIAIIIVLCQVADRLTMPYYGKRIALSEPNRPGEFAVTTFETLQGVYIDKIKYPFVNDPNVIGKWMTVDFVEKPEDFAVGQKHWRGNLWFKGIEFFKGGTTHAWRWTKGLVLDPYTSTAARYTIKTIDGSQYMFFEWKSGDYTILHRKPCYYILKKETDTSAAQVTSSSTPAKLDANGEFVVETHTDEQGRYVDRLDYPFVSDPQVIGKWVSVDFVQKPDDFRTDEQHWPGELFLKNLYFFDGGTTGGPWTWTKGLVFHPGEKTAARYTIKTIDGKEYLFFEWKSGDYTIRHDKPRYYVLKKEDGPAAKDDRVQKAEQIVQLMSQRQFDAVVNSFDETMKAALPGSKLADVWTQLEQAGGAFKGIDGAARTERQGSMTVVFVPCTWEHNELDFKIVFNDGKVSGLWTVAPAPRTK